MMFDWGRMSGRTWATEYFARVSRMIFEIGTHIPVESFRKMLSKVGMPNPVLKQVDWQSIEIEGISGLAVKPFEHADNQRIIVYLHGGGYVVGSPESYRVFLALLAVHCNAQVIAPDYRLSPEHPFPAAQDDCLAVVKSVRESNPNSTLIVMGDSAGGGLSTTTALAYSQIDAIVLISPWVEPTLQTGSMVSNEVNDIFTREFLNQSYQAHMQKSDLYDARVNFNNADLSGLPTTYIQAGGGELFHDQIIDFSKRAEQQGVNIEVDIYPTQFHVFQILAPMLKDSKQALVKIADFVRSVSR